MWFDSKLFVLYNCTMHVTTNLHHIRKHILRQLVRRKWARFRDLRPDRVDSNLYNYHLKQLVKDGFIEHNLDNGYRLSPMGLRYADHVSLETFEPRWQPKVITVFVAMNTRGEYLLWKKYKQPFINKLSLPSGKMHYEDESLPDAMRRELSYFLDHPLTSVHYKGVMEYRAFIEGTLVTHTLAHVFSGDIAGQQVDTSRLFWTDIKSLKSTEMSPGTRETIEATENYSDIFFESHDIHW